MITHLKRHVRLLTVTPVRSFTTSPVPMPDRSPSEILDTISEIHKSIPKRNDRISVLADVFDKLRESPFFSTEETVRLVALCARTGVYDSELFELLEEAGPGDLSASKGLQLVKALVKLNEGRFFGEWVMQWLDQHRSGIADLSLTKGTIPVLDYTRIVVAGTDDHIKLRLGQMTLDLVSLSVGEKSKLLQSDKDLLVNRSVVCSDEVNRLIVGLGSIVRGLKKSGVTPSITDPFRSDLMFLVSSVLAYDLRNLSIEELFKVYFSISEIGLFDDFFVRRRLVPAIAAIFQTTESPQPKQVLLLATMLTQLPFRNPMVDDLIGVVRKAAEAVGTKDKTPLERLLKQLSRNS
jgi:hypothetical protein